MQIETNNHSPLWSDLSSIISKSSSSSGISSESTFLVVVVWVELDIVKSVSEDHKYWAPLSLSSSPYGIPSLWILLRPKKSFQHYLHPVLGSCKFQWCSFHLCTFSKNSPNIQHMQFLINKWIPSLVRFWLLMTLSAADFVHVDFCQT